MNDKQIGFVLYAVSILVLLIELGVGTGMRQMLVHQSWSRREEIRRRIKIMAYSLTTIAVVVFGCALWFWFKGS